MRFLPVVLALAVTACTTVGTAEVVDTSAPTTTTTASTTSTTTTPTSTTVAEVVVETDPVAGITPTGIVVTIRASGAGRHIVGTPCANSAVVEDLEPIHPVDIVIDPGHGGDVETGSVGANGLREADLNLTVARKLRDWLADEDISSVLTRDGDYRMAIRARVELTQAIQPKLFVSVHHNAGDISAWDEPGTIVFHQAEDDESRRAAGLLYEELVSALAPLDLPWVASNPPGATAAVRGSDGFDAYGVLRLNYPVPAVLTEAMFLQNRPEAEALATEEVQDLEVEALGAAIVRFLETDDEGTGHYDPLVYNFPVSATGGTDGCVDPDLGS